MPDSGSCQARRPAFYIAFNRPQDQGGHLNSLLDTMSRAERLLHDRLQETDPARARAISNETEMESQSLEPADDASEEMSL